MAIYQDGVKVQSVYSAGSEVKKVYNNGELVFSSEPQYVTDGLIMHLDGHTPPSSNVWQDLSPSENHLPLSSGVSYDPDAKGYVFNGTSRSVSSKNLALPTGNFPFTVETVFKAGRKVGASHEGICWFGGTSITPGIMCSMFIFNGMKYQPSFMNVEFLSNSPVIAGKTECASFAKSDGDFRATDYSLLFNNNQMPYTWSGSGLGGTFQIPASPLYVGQAWPYSMTYRYLYGTIHNIRIYNRQLTLEEQQRNYAIDKKRFNII